MNYIETIDSFWMQFIPQRANFVAKGNEDLSASMYTNFDKISVILKG